MSEETIFKPLSDVERLINETSAGDLLLFMVALDRKQKADKLSSQYDNTSKSNS